MANHSKFNRVIRKLDGRKFYCKCFYDSYWNKIDMNKNEVYLRKEVEDIIKELREVYEEQQDEILIQKRKAYDIKKIKLEVIEDV